MNSRLLAPLLALLLLASLRPGFVAPVHADGELGVSVREVTIDDSALVQFLAKVVDENGRPLRLSGNGFTVTAGDQQIPVTGLQTVTDAAVGISALLVIDTSGSMVGTPLADAHQAAAQYVQTLQPTDEVAVVSFANGTRVIADFSRDFAAVEALIPGLTAFGDTALYSAVSDAARRISERPAARRVVIFLSDGADFGISAVGRQQSIADAAAGGAPYYVIGLGPTIDTAYLQDLASASGGAFFAAPSSNQLAGIFAEIAELLRLEYVVSVDFAGTGLGGDTSVTIRADDGARNGEVVITIALPAIPVAPQPRPTQPGPVIPQPIQEQPVPEPEPSSSNAGVIILAALLLAGLGALVWLFLRRRKKRQREHYVFGAAPIFTPRGADTDAIVRDAPPAVLRLDSGEELRLQGVATLGIDPECTHQLPLTRAEFGNAELRVWFANQRYVIRDASPRTRMRVNGRPTSWAFLSDGDIVEIRGLKLQFAVTAPAPSTG